MIEDGEIFNVGSARDSYQIGPLGEIVADCVPRDVEIEWYGDPDHRSYRVAFDKIEALGYRAEHTAEDGVREPVFEVTPMREVRQPVINDMRAGTQSG